MRGWSKKSIFSMGKLEKILNQIHTEGQEAYNNLDEVGKAIADMQVENITAGTTHFRITVNKDGTIETEPINEADMYIEGKL